jgi:hypothetical protein
MQEQNTTHMSMYLIIWSRNEDRPWKNDEESNCYLSHVIFPSQHFALGNPGR